ncbi:MAG: hypothetical protein HY321_01950 [Armatimonadetes bacterium]|nr:hypothetical protein [Armatimonadota bacterium]
MIRIEETNDLRTPHLPPGENAMSRRYLRMLERWIPVGVEYFAEWPVRPNCGHFFGGAHWYGSETASPAEAFAVASAAPEHNAAATGVSRNDLRRMAVMGVRYLGFTHDTGPEECVRPSVGLGRPENCGTKWGERGKGFFRESQCGSRVATLADICLLLREHTDEETWMMVARIHEDYAGRFGALPPRSGIYVDTQMEENAWTAAGLTSCSLFLSRHPQAAEWEAMTRRWMFSTCAAPQDAKDWGNIGEAVVRTLAGKTFTTLPDYWAENHGMAHPSYTGSGVHSLGSIGTQLRLWGRELPTELLWNRRRVYESLKAITDGGGYAQAVQGMDWHNLPAVGSETVHAIAAVFFGDPDAAALQRRALRNAELRQEANGGRLYDREFAARAHDQQDPMIMREVSIGSVVRLYLLHRLFGPGPEPTPEEELERRLRGVRVFPHAGFVHHRHPRGQTSLAWRNAIMALPLTREGIYTVAPASGTWLAAPVVHGRPDSHRLVSVRVAESADAFAAALVIDRCQESLRQQVLFASLPDGRVLSWERLVAREDLALESLDQGMLKITNETFPLLGPNSRGARVLYRPEGATEYRGGLSDSESDDRVDLLGHPEWLNVDDRIGIRFAGPGDALYHNRHFHRPYRAIADDLVLSRLPATPLRAGEAAPPLSALLLPEQAHADTPGSEFSLLQGDADTACLMADGFAAAANFGPEPRVCRFAGARPALIPAYAGATVEAVGGEIRCLVPLEAGTASLLRAVRMVRAAGDVRVDVAADGRALITNFGTTAADVGFAGGEGDVVRLAPGEVRAWEPMLAQAEEWL